MNRFSLQIPLLAFTLVFLSACKTLKIDDRKVTIVRNAEKVIAETKANNIKYKTAQLKANVSITDGKRKTSFKANIRMIKDSIIWSSLSMVGFAGARTLITGDSIKIVNYREKNYILEPYSRIESYINSDMLDLENLQKLMIGDWLYMSEFDRYRLKYNDTNYVVSTLSERRLEKDWVEKKIEKLEKKIERQEERDAEKAQETLEKKQERKPRKYEGLAVEVKVDPLDFKVKNLYVVDYYFDGRLNASYSNFKKIGDKNIPHNVDITVEGKKYLKVEIEYYKISLDEEINTSFSIPKKYERARL